MSDKKNLWPAKKALIELDGSINALRDWVAEFRISRREFAGIVAGLDLKNFTVQPRSQDRVVARNHPACLSLHYARLKAPVHNEVEAGLNLASEDTQAAATRIINRWMTCWPSCVQAIQDLRKESEALGIPVLNLFHFITNEQKGLRAFYNRTTRSFEINDPVWLWHSKSDVDFFSLAQEARESMGDYPYEKQGEPWSVGSLAFCRDALMMTRNTFDLMDLCVELDRSPGAIYAMWQKMGLVNYAGKRYALMKITDGVLTQIPAPAGFDLPSVAEVLTQKSQSQFGRSAMKNTPLNTSSS